MGSQSCHLCHVSLAIQKLLFLAARGSMEKALGSTAADCTEKPSRQLINGDSLATAPSGCHPRHRTLGKLSVLCTMRPQKRTKRKKTGRKKKKRVGGEVVIGVRSSMTRYISHLAVGSPRAPSPPATTRTPGGAERGSGGSPCPGSWWPQVARSRPPPGWARPQARTLAPQPPLLEPEDADLGENVHQVAVAEPAVLAGAVPPPAGRGPVPVLLPRLPLLADQAAGDGRCHGCSPARPRRSAPRRAGGGRRGAQPRRGPIPGGAGERAREPPPGRGAAAAGPPPPCGPRELLPPRVTAWVLRRPSRPAPTPGARSARNGARRARGRPALRGARSGRRLRLPRLPLSPALPPPARPPLPSARLGRLPPPLPGSCLMIAKCFGNQHLERAISFSWESCNHSPSVPPRSSLPTRAHAHTRAPLELFCPPELRGGEGKGVEEERENKGRGAGGAADAVFWWHTASSQRIFRQQRPLSFCFPGRPVRGSPRAGEDSAGSSWRHTWPGTQRHPPHIQTPWHTLSPTPCHHAPLTLPHLAAAGGARICRRSLATSQAASGAAAQRYARNSDPKAEKWG